MALLFGIRMAVGQLADGSQRLCNIRVFIDTLYITLRLHLLGEEVAGACQPSAPRPLEEPIPHLIGGWSEWDTD